MSTEDLMERCVAAGIAVRRAHRTAVALRAEAQHRALTPGERAQLAGLESDATRLSNEFVAAQGPIAKANPELFRQRLAEVTRRIDEQLARER